ncbi:hypothetical protein KR044_000994 [Drosophila immigrans]|nr:hypothetical protein KR044_000994 [Drosophila immigrans]
MICFYGCHKQENKMTYSLGKVPGDKCRCGSDRDFKNLCDKSERYGDCALIKDQNLEDNLMTTTASTSKKRRSRLEAELLNKIREWVLDQNYSAANSLEVTTDL